MRSYIHTNRRKIPELASGKYDDGYDNDDEDDHDYEDDTDDNDDDDDDYELVCGLP